MREVLTSAATHNDRDVIRCGQVSRGWWVCKDMRGWVHCRWQRRQGSCQTSQSIMRV